MATASSADEMPGSPSQPCAPSLKTDMEVPAGEISTSFRESKISIAIDVSGSTYGEILTAEKRAVKSICSLIPPSLHDNITVLPWNDEAEQPRPVSRLDTLQSTGGTDPNVILDDSECRLVLQSSGFWLLMTDGIIEDSVVRAFARNLADYGIHGKACIISVFGTRLEQPSDCNISVGLSVFAVSPHVAFLYTDVDSDRTYVMSTKGCFSALLPRGKRNPRLDYNTSWDDLPRVSYENLTRVSVAADQNLGRDEIALQGDTRVSIAAILEQETIDEDLMRKIMLNEDNMKTIAITAKLKGDTDKLRKWLDKVDEKLEQDIQTEASVSVQGSQLLKEVETRLSSMEGPEPTSLYGRQTTVGNNNASTFWQSRNRACRRSSNEMRGSISADYEHDFFSPSRNLSCIDGEHLHPEQEDPGEPAELEQEWATCSKTALLSPLNAQGRTGTEHDRLNLKIAGFRQPTQNSEHFSNFCSTCARSDSVLALVLKTPPKSTMTKNFPLPNSLSRLVYPLTMGNYAETDIIANIVACDACTKEMAKRGNTPLDETVTAVLPLVSYSKNQEAWLQTLALATRKRFSRSDLALVFLSILFTKMERLVADPSTLREDLLAALRWECKMIQTEVVLQTDIIPAVNFFGAGLIHEVLLRNFRNSLAPEKFTLLLGYPLDGFIVANAALSNSRFSQVLSQEKRKTIVFLRFLYQLLEGYRRYEKENGDVQLHAAKTLILLIDDSSGPRSLFKWKSLRQFSVHFKNLEEFQMHLREMVTLTKYKLSLQVTDLLDTPLLDATTLATFRRLGPLFSWIESEAGHGTAVFVHYLMRLDVGKCSPEMLYQKLRERPEVKEAMADPGALSARTVERLIKPLPPLD